MTTHRAATPPPPDAPRLRVGLIGAGRAGVVMAAALARAGHETVAVSAVSDESRDRAAAVLPGVPVRDAMAVPKDADLVLLAVPEAELTALVSGLVATRALHPGQILVHLHPAEGIGVLEPAVGCDVLPLAIHPAVALAGRPSDVDRLVGASCAVTTLRSLRPLAEALVLEMGAEPVWIEEEDRIAYAAALAAVRDSIAGVIGAAGVVLADCGIDHVDRMLGPLAHSATEEALEASSVSAQRSVDRPSPHTPKEHS
jgi:predicted short-subunit dehydrogenase-like oxidoreductase (DUF2520 family)